VEQIEESANLANASIFHDLCCKIWSK